MEVGRRFADELICRPVDDYTYVEKISVFKDGELIAAGSLGRIGCIVSLVFK